VTETSLIDGDVSREAQYRTTAIVLANDGALRMASLHTKSRRFWHSPQYGPTWPEEDDVKCDLKVEPPKDVLYPRRPAYEGWGAETFQQRESRDNLALTRMAQELGDRLHTLGLDWLPE
jgi:hypothetical protein